MKKHKKDFVDELAGRTSSAEKATVMMGKLRALGYKVTYKRRKTAKGSKFYFTVKEDSNGRSPSIGDRVLLAVVEAYFPKAKTTSGSYGFGGPGERTIAEY